MNQNRSAGSVLELDAPGTGAPSPELKRLEVFLGRWKGDGDSYPDAPLPGRMTTIDTYEWLPGGFFLVNHGEIRIAGHEPVPHLWIWSYDTETGTYPIRAFDGQGYYRVYEATVGDRTWIISGNSERAMLVFDPNGNGFRANWELTRDGKDWRPLCDVKATRMG